MKLEASLQSQSTASAISSALPSLPMALLGLGPREMTMTYDWEGPRTRRVMAFKLMTAVAVGLSVPLALTVWSYIG